MRPRASRSSSTRRGSRRSRTRRTTGCSWTWRTSTPRRAAAHGVDAILIDSTCDWGIEAIRAVVDVPVAGAGEVGIAEASAGGRRFGIVTIWPPALEFIYTEWARTVPGGERCTGIRVR